MELSIAQAAARLGKSPRQVRYLINSGVLRARKVDGRWVMNSSDLPDSPGQQAATERQQLQMHAAVDRGLELPAKPERSRGSVHDLKAFSIGVPLYDKAAEAIGSDHPATLALRTMLEHLARGYHRYDYSEKTSAYREARDAASLAVCELVLSKKKPATELTDEIEQNLMAALAGVLRRIERKRLRKP